MVAFTAERARRRDADPSGYLIELGERIDGRAGIARRERNEPQCAKAKTDRHRVTDATGCLQVLRDTRLRPGEVAFTGVDRRDRFTPPPSLHLLACTLRHFDLLLGMATGQRPVARRHLELAELVEDRRHRSFVPFLCGGIERLLKQRPRAGDLIALPQHGSEQVPNAVGHVRGRTTRFQGECAFREP